MIKSMDNNETPLEKSLENQGFFHVQKRKNKIFKKSEKSC
jgi:hypothetical protein